ncbi:exodeoxyribonuclease V subunit beta [Legionella sp. km772]|uniref:UvrD-helicase domain-containing protein n=1 Tax=Legionella sp. km772 TaxID=2498111 RepID=UPI000F8E5F65|nr:UvrD-helicase domain-containing protein [Legionella sp. km772]RUR13894.1 ATP-dependent DNA helicase [Legionella sp. km772]
MTLIDGEQRARATDPNCSFIVQAPAGSGKTEILTQRYLRLLSTVSAPEQIIALTFTRKAASEMRERIILALQQASAKKTAKSAHHQVTLNFAQQALEQDARCEWNLLDHANRLKIITIDSLCNSINHAIPLLEQQIAYAQITDKPERHYLNAGRQCIQFAIDHPDYHSSIKTLLLHVDNKQELLLSLFKDLLIQRDQWLSPLFQARIQDKTTFEQALQFIEQHELARLKKSLPLELAYQLVMLSKELVQIENNPESPRYPLNNWNNFNEITPELAKALCQLILGSDQNIRKSFDHHVGLKSGSCPPAQYKQLKENSKELLLNLQDYPEFHAALLQVSQLPKPEYDLEQWEVLQALFHLLPILVSHLHLLFIEHNELDFTTISQQALTALGNESNPTDLALYLDNAIHHLLIDEFQDTSISQFELITRLLQGWQPGDGKTLFIVGDPMQSIYRFRQAEVGLFFRAKTQGIGPVQLNFLQLQCNFRSTNTIVNWINQQFIHVFPKEIDIESGAVPFHPSVHVVEDTHLSAIHAIECSNREQEANYLIARIREELAADKEQSLAILVRSRSQLSTIINLLREHQIPYQGTDIARLAHLPHLRDVWSITQALLMPANRLSWLACLRSPYCGLLLNDLHSIAQFNTSGSIYSNLVQIDKISELSDEGRLRARFFMQVMQEALSLRGQVHLSEWVGNTLKKLHLEIILNQDELNDLEQFWSLLDRYDEEGRLSNINEFYNELVNLYSQQSSVSRLQIMTIHKSKGLEFDTVFLPSLGAQPSRSDAPLLRWLKLPSTQEDIFLVSPIKGAHQEQCLLYDYLNTLDEEKAHYEAQRLFYVAVTRAKKRLYLLDGTGKTAKKSFRGLLKQQEFTIYEPQQLDGELGTTLPQLSRLPIDFYLSPPQSNPRPLNPIPALQLAIPRLLGVVTHRLLQWICDNHPQTVKDLPWDLIEQELTQLGLDKETKTAALSSITDQMIRLFQDPIGQWIIAPHHNEHNEYELLLEKDNSLVTRIIDRTFEDQHSLWIIDFKTGKEDKISDAKYQQQLQEYAQYLAQHSLLPIQCGLYYLASNHWQHWHYEPEFTS